MTKQIEAISKEFGRKILFHLGRDIAIEIDVRNQRRNDGDHTCASHDFCDSNVYMVMAFEDVVGHEADCGSQDDVDLINAAWAITKKRGFASTEVH